VPVKGKASSRIEKGYSGLFPRRRNSWRIPAELPEGAPYVVSELLEAESLRERVGGAALPTPKTMERGKSLGLSRIDRPDAVPVKIPIVIRIFLWNPQLDQSASGAYCLPPRGSGAANRSRACRAMESVLIALSWASLTMRLSAGARIGPYEILAPLGAGGMGEVYRARDTRLARDVAAKVLPVAFSVDPDRLRRFQQEARAASALNHPNILTIYDVGEHGGAPYVVSEFLDGETLRERLAGAALPVRKAMDYGIQIAEGLAAAHEKGIVHRDLKPENLFVTKDGRMKILDFGLAKLVGAEAGSGARTDVPTVPAGTEPGVVMGTVGYMSPEQVRGQAADQRSDIFAFGAILYEMLTGKRAFHGTSAADTMSAILKEEPEFAPTHPDVLPALEHIIRRCLEKSPEERFQSARDLAFALRETSISPVVGPSVVSPVSRSRPILWFAAVGAVVFLALLVALDVGGLKERLFGGGRPAPIRSLAVLPLENLSRDPGEEYFADGMTEALIADLARIGAIRVISRTSVMRYKGTRRPLPDIARELGVDAVVEGSVLRSGDRVRITAQLIEAQTDRHLWAESYERDAHDVLALQREIARSIAAAIRIKLTEETQARFSARSPVDPEAHREYLQGRFHWNKRTEAALRRAIRHFERATEIDPSFALAYAGLGDCYVLLPAGGMGASPPREALPRAHAAATKALEIDDGLAEAHATLAYERLYVWDWKASEHEFRRAIELNPSYATAHFWFAAHLAARGRLEDALTHARLAQSLDPVSPIIAAGVAWMHHLARDFDAESEQARRALELDPNFAIGHLRLSLGLAHRARYPEAIGAMRSAVTLSDDSPNLLAALGYISALAGETGAARDSIGMLEGLSRNRYVSAYDVALVHLGLGGKEEALRWLEKAYGERAWGLTFLKVEPALDPLRDDPRFQDLLRRIGLG